MTIKEIKQRQQLSKEMYDYPKHLVIENRTEEGKEEVILKIPPHKQQIIDDMVYKNINMMTSNVGKCLVAQQRYVTNQLDEGYQLEVPEHQKWHSS